MKRCATAFAALAVLASQSACYTTRVVSAARPEGPPYSDRQWFTLGGLAPLSQPTGQQCRHGVSYAESKLSGTDWLIDVGLGVAGAIAGGVACANVGDDLTRSSCITAGATLVPFLLSSRTVEYACAAGPARERDFMPPPHQGYAPPPPQDQSAPPVHEATPPPPPPSSP